MISYSSQATTRTTQAPSNVRYYTWNKTAVSSRDYQQSYCPARCQGDRLVYTNNILQQVCPTFYCTTCTCHRPSCQIYGSCCPSVEDNYAPPPGLKSGIYNISEFNETIFLENNPDAIPGFVTAKQNPVQVFNQSKVSPPKLGCDSEYTSFYFLYVRSCLADYNGDKDTVRLCEGELSDDDVTTAYVTRVVDNVTQVVYKNRYCAVCNRVTEMVPLLTKIYCYHYMTVYTATTADQMLRLALTKNSTCNVTQTFPYNVSLAPCDPVQYSKKLLDCNSTTYDVDVVRACQDLTGPIYPVYIRFPFRYYKNIFCGICSLKMFPNWGVCDFKLPGGGPQPPPVRIYPPLSLLINFGNRLSEDDPPFRMDEIDANECNDTQWSSPNGECLTLECTPGKVLTNRSCATAIQDITGLAYSLRVWLVPDMRHQLVNWTDGASLATVTKHIQKMLQDLRVEYSIKVGTISINQTLLTASNFSSQGPAVFWVDGAVIAGNDKKRDEFEEEMTRQFVTSSMTLDIDATNVTFSRRVMPSQFDVKFYCNTTVADIGINCTAVDLKSENFTSKQDKMKFVTSYLNVSMLLTCSYVRLNNTNYTIHIDNTSIPPAVKVEIELKDKRIVISENMGLNMLQVEEGVSVCHSYMEEKLRELESVQNNELVQGQGYPATDVVFAEYILTLICMTLSMLSLVLTLMTYVKFPVLRSRAGHSNMCLSGSLLLAQVSLLISSHLSGPSSTCTTFGVLTHFLWLWMITWTFTCSLQMFRVFTSKTRSSGLTPGDQTLHYIRQGLTTLLVPATISAAVVTSSLVSTRGSTIGYGVTVCYLNSTFLIGVSLVMPMALINLTNLTMFAITVVKIYRVGKLQVYDSSRLDDHRNLGVYVKLSSLTGAFWTLAIIAEAADVTILRFFSNVLNGLQGVFIFLSFICNRRVLNLYLVWAGLEPWPNVSGSKIKTTSSSLKY
ncbi:uncharacterized protein LOC131931322 [Physella acuta]|uniref:uncharacterized protein LOC131931322 n=1 Tax=Physella acuta TaxID=109671 RepID=UPI0027DD8EB0|nr:uncharacterized protein LOC131931322 [Physella acuta]